MYFKPKNNLERVVDELKSRNYNVTDYNTKRKSQFPLKKSWVALPAFAQLPDSDKDSDDSKSEEIVPKQILAGLHNKTYFKGVTSLIAKPDLHKSLNPNIEPLANSVLKSCNVKPKEVHSVFLKAGNGRLVSNPEESILDTYEKLKISMKTQ